MFSRLFFLIWKLKLKYEIEDAKRNLMLETIKNGFTTTVLSSESSGGKSIWQRKRILRKVFLFFTFFCNLNFLIIIFDFLLLCERVVFKPSFSNACFSACIEDYTKKSFWCLNSVERSIGNLCICLLLSLTASLLLLIFVHSCSCGSSSWNLRFLLSSSFG